LFVIKATLSNIITCIMSNHVWFIFKRSQNSQVDRYVNIGGIVDHHRLNFLLIILFMTEKGLSLEVIFGFKSFVIVLFNFELVLEVDF
jgi:hypothetical protein